MRGCLRKLGIAIAVIAIIVAAIGAYWYRGKRLYERAWDAHHEGRAAEALDLYRTISQQYPSGRFFDEMSLYAPPWVPTFDYALYARYRVPDFEAYVHAADVHASGRVDEAIAAYESFLGPYREWENSFDLYDSLAREALADLELERARGAWDDGQYSEAVAAYRSVLELRTVVAPHCAPRDARDTWGAACQRANLITEESRAQARAAMPSLFVEWAQTLERQANYGEYVETYQAIVQAYPDVLAEEKVRVALAEVYGGWAAQLRGEGDYEEAIAKCLTVLQELPDTPTGAHARTVLAELYGEWALELRKTKAYESAIEKYQIILSEYADTPFAARAAGLAAETYGEWAAQLRADGRYQQAIDRYGTIGQEYPHTPVAGRARALAAEVYMEWAAQLRADEHYQQAIDRYQTIGQEYADAPAAGQAEALAAGTYSEWAAQLCAAKSYPLAMAKYQTLLEEYPATAAASKTEVAIGELYQVAVQAMAEGEYCTAVPILGAFAGADLPFVNEAAASMPEALYRCGMAEYEAGKYGEAIVRYETLIEDYPGSAWVAGAQAALVDARVADIKRGKTGALPPPQVSGSAPAGSAVVVISNDSPERLEVLLSGPGSQSLTIDECASCQTYSIVGPLFCPEKGPKATITLTPGSYEVIVRATSDPSITPWFGSWALEDGREHFNCFFIVTTFGSR